MWLPRLRLDTRSHQHPVVQKRQGTVPLRYIPLLGDRGSSVFGGFFNLLKGTRGGTRTSGGAGYRPGNFVPTESEAARTPEWGVIGGKVSPELDREDDFRVLLKT